MNYKEVVCPNHPKTHSNGCVYEHILVAEQKIGRYLTEEEVVHHIDENKLNNSPDNLMVFATNADHVRFHKTGLCKLEGDHYIGLDNFKKCPVCGKKVKSNQNKYCSYECYNIDNKKDLPVTREELKDLIRKKSFVQIGIDFKVTDNAIRKWCKRYNLPFKAYEIKKIPDSDWEKI